jgi:hypothetical protein
MDHEKLRRLGLDKVAFLVLLLLGFVLAKFIISYGSKLELSQPLALKGTGLEISVPFGDSWKRLSNGFKYENNEFTFSCLMQISGDSAITMQWHYSLLPATKTVPERLQAEAESIKGRIESSASGKFGDYNFDYAKIVSEKITVFYGTTVLPDGRILTLELGQSGRGIDLADKIFRNLLASVKYNPDNPVVKGAELLKTFKTSLGVLLAQGASPNYYRLKDTRGASIGFTTDSIGYFQDANENSVISAAGLLFLSSGFNAYAEQSIFYSNISLSKFDWVVKQGNMLTNREVPIHIQLNDQLMTVQKQNITEKLGFTGSMLPEPFFDLAVEAFLKSNFDSVMFDVVVSEGKIAPVILSRINSPETSVLPAESAANVELFATTPTTQKMYFGESKLLSADVQSSLSYRIERTSRADIIADFPQWLDKIQRMEQYRLKKDVKKQSGKAE